LDDDIFITDVIESALDGHVGGYQWEPIGHPIKREIDDDTLHVNDTHVNVTKKGRFHSDVE